MKAIILSVFVVPVLFACGKKYNCVCTNPGGSKTELVITGSKSKADRKCKEYYDKNYGAIPWNETSCEIK